MGEGQVGVYTHFLSEAVSLFCVFLNDQTKNLISSMKLSDFWKTVINVSRIHKTQDKFYEKCIYR